MPIRTIRDESMFGSPAVMSLVKIWWNTVMRKIPTAMNVNPTIWIFASSGMPVSSWRTPPGAEAPCPAFAAAAAPAAGDAPTCAAACDAAAAWLGVSLDTRPLWTYPLVIPLAATAVPVLKPRTVRRFTGISLSAEKLPCSARSTHSAV